MAHIRIKKTKDKDYYYLEHTIREGKAFRNKQIYLGTHLPANINILTERFMHELFEELYDKQLKTIKKKFAAEFSSYPKSAKKKHIEDFMIKFTYNTNKIEGSTLSLKETADLLEEHITPRNKSLEDVKETEAHKKVFYEMLKYKKELTISSILHWHKELFKSTDAEIAGKIRKHPVAIARTKVKLPIPAELDTLLHEFFIWYRKYKDKTNPVILAALVHLKFVTIHPFSDGNGRISRIMMNFILHKHNYPMLNIEYSNRNAYYNALERSQTQSKDYIFVQYLIKRYFKRYQEYMAE